MSTNHTPNYNLCQWEAADKVVRTDFNQDNATIDAELGRLATQVDRNTTLIKFKGNCSVICGYYTGDGKYGAAYPTAHYCSKRPYMFIVFGGQAITFCGGALAMTIHPGSDGKTLVAEEVNFKWDPEKETLNFYANNARDQLNSANVCYQTFEFYTPG